MDVWHRGWPTTGIPPVVALPLPLVQVWGAGGSLKVTILQSSDSRAFSTVPITPVPRAGDPASAAPAAGGTPAKQTLQFFCYLCKANCSSQQVLPAGAGEGGSGGQSGGVGGACPGLATVPEWPRGPCERCPRQLCVRSEDAS